MEVNPAGTVVATSFRGAPAFRLANTNLIVTVLPEHGNKIASILFTGIDGSARELLYQHQGPVLPPVTPGLFSSDQSWGWDDMFPSIEAEGEIPDHGEVWSLPWDHWVSTDGSTLGTEVRGSCLPYTLRRTMSVRDRTLTLVWDLENRSRRRIPYFWAAHPLFSVEPDSWFSGPAEYVLNAVRSTILPVPEQLYPFPVVHVKEKPVRIDGFPLYHEPVALKYYFPYPVENTALPVYLHKPSHGIRIALAWDVTTAPFLGVWINNGAWGNQKNLALEPATGLLDGPTAATRHNSGSILDPEATITWWMSLTIDET